MSPKYSLIIPTKGNLQNVCRLLNSLSSLAEIEQAEILLVLNPPSDRFNQIKRLFPQLTIKILFSETGVNFARNRGLKSASGDILFFLDDDCWIKDPFFLNKRAQAHQKSPWAFAIGGPYLTNNRSEIVKEYGQIQHQWLSSNQLSSNGECSTLLGGNFSILRQSKLPLFDESIIYGGAETEYFFRLKKLGYRFLLTASPVYHDPQLTILSFLKKAYLQGKTHRRLMKTQVFQSALWTFPGEASLMKTLYTTTFNFDWKSVLLQPVRSLQKKLKRWHHDFWFYLSNRNSF